MVNVSYNNINLLQVIFILNCRPKDGKDDASYGGYHLSYEVKKLM